MKTKEEPKKVQVCFVLTEREQVLIEELMDLLAVGVTPTQIAHACMAHELERRVKELRQTLKPRSQSKA